MASDGTPTVLALSNAAYSCLLRACPAQFRRAYGGLMAQAFRDLAREAHGRRGPWGIVALWLRILPDTCSTAIAEHIVALKERHALADVELAAVDAQGGYTMRSTLSATAGSAVALGTLLAGALSVWPVYTQALLALIWRLAGGFLAGPLGVATLPVAFWAFWVNVLLSDLGRYLALSAAGILLALAALCFGPRSRALRVAEALTLVGILAFPWLFHYQPPVVAAPGHMLEVATQPGLLEGAVKRAQASAERVPSSYEILGWSSDGVLYYQETDTAKQATRTWAYRPGQDGGPRSVAGPAHVVPTAASPREALLELVRAPAWPESAEESTRSLKIRQDGLASPDGRWAAAVAKHIYGPEDVIVVVLE